MNKAVLAWILNNTGFQFSLSPDASPVDYIDASGVPRTRVYHGSKDTETMLKQLKKYVNWRLTQVDNYPELTFSVDHTYIKISKINPEFNAKEL